MVITFDKINIEDKTLFEQYLGTITSRSCEYTFANMLLWSRHFNIEYAIIEDFLVLKHVYDGAYSYPIGSGDRKKVVETLLNISKERNVEFKMHVTAEFSDEILDILKDLGEDATFTSNRDTADYIYLSESLETLKGKKLHGKRNHINKFKKLYPNWSYEEISEDNIKECYQMALEWCKQNSCSDDESGSSEICVVKNSLLHMDELELKGGLLKIDGEVVAFTIGEEACEDTFIVHIEKAFHDLQGAYTMINQQFVENSIKGYKYINREEDLGVEGLRKAKLSYYPEMLIEKGTITIN